MGLRDRKRDKARSDIEAAAYRLFAEHGFEGTTVEMIAEEAFVSPRTIYRYFGSKEDIVFSEFDYDIGAIETELRRRCADGVSLRCVTDAFAAHLAVRQGTPWFSARMRLMNESPSLMAHAARFRIGLGQRLSVVLAELGGKPEPGLDEHVMARVAVTITAVALTEWAQEGGTGDVSTLLQRAADTID